MARKADPAEADEKDPHAGHPAAPTPEDLGPEELAAEFIARLSDGESVERRSFLDRLPDDAARAEFEELIRDAERVERSLPRALSAGTVLSNRYRILSEIGGGGMGRVFAALDLRLERQVAVKVLSAENLGRRDVEDLFLKESKLLASLQHPNIVSVHEAGRDGDLAYIVMDLVDGTALSDVIERARKELKTASSGAAPSPRDGRLLERAIGKELPHGRSNLIDASDWYASAARIMLEVARTIEAAHGLGVIHRDLKPGNVMLLGGGHPVVLDFGLAGSAGLKAGTVTQGLYGSVAYLAPEQAQSHRVGMDPRTDVYQLGLILYELLTLQRAFPGLAIGDVLGRIKDGLFPAPRQKNPAVPRDLESICMMALELDPARRYASANALREDLERYVDGSAVPLAVRSDRWRTAVRGIRIFGRTHPIYSGVAGMAAAALIVGLFFLTRSPPPPPSPFFRFNNEENQVVPLPEHDGVVEQGDKLGLELATNAATWVYTLSVFGDEGAERYFYPYVTAPEDQPDRVHNDMRPWGLEVGPGRHNVLCTDIANAQNKYEGLLVFVSSRERPQIDDWFDRLREANGTGKVSFAEAAKLLEIALGPPRGVPDGRHYTDAEVKRISEKLKASAQAKDPWGFDLPEAVEFRIECVVAGK